MVTMKVYDMPGWLATLPPSLPTSLKTLEASLNDGSIISEVGKPVILDYPMWKGKIAGFQLRAPLKKKMPSHMFGKFFIGDGFAALQDRIHQLPVLDKPLILDPVMTKGQARMCEMGSKIRADALWILHVPCPLGTAIELRLSCPQIDAEAKTRGILWKPMTCNTIALYVPWRSDQWLRTDDVNRQGPGLSVKVELISNSSNSDLVAPLNMLSLSAICNLHITNLHDIMGLVTDKALNFVEVPPPKSLDEESDSEAYGDIVDDDD